MNLTLESSSEEKLKETSGSRKWLVMLGVGIGVLMFGLDVHIVNLSLPTLVQGFHTSFATIQLVTLSYLVTLTVLMLGAARLGDLINKKWLYTGGLIVFTVSSLLCGLSTSISFLICFRVFQGIGAVFVSALAAAIITEVFPSSMRGRALGILSGIFTLGIAIGPTVGGLLMSLGSWRFIFLINVPLGIIASAIAGIAVPSSVTSEVKQSFDVVGLLLLALILSCFIWGMNLFQSDNFNVATKITILAIAAVGLVYFLRFESGLNEPLLNLEIFHNLYFSLSLLLNLIVYIVMVGVIFVLPFFLELVKHYPVQQTGLLMAVSPILFTLVSPISGTLSDRFGERIISIIGLLLAAVGCWAIGTVDTQLTWLGYIVRMAPYAVGLAIFQSPNNSAVMGAVSPQRLGIASGLLSLSRTLGQTIGLSLMGVLFSTLTISKMSIGVNFDVTNAPVEALVFGTQMSFRVVGVVLLVPLILASVLWWQEKLPQKRND
ncbi:MAG: MFS transporter [Microcoleaceae cyanobacterium]